MSTKIAKATVLKPNFMTSFTEAEPVKLPATLRDRSTGEKQEREFLLFELSASQTIKMMEIRAKYQKRQGENEEPGAQQPSGAEVEMMLTLLEGSVMECGNYLSEEELKKIPHRLATEMIRICNYLSGLDQVEQETTEKN